MSSVHESEIRGDWNDLKGAHYHFIYALWVLLCERGHRVSFYQGNDLHLAPAPALPPMLDETDAGDDTLPVVSLKVDHQERGSDIWVQLKATTAPWTLAALLSPSTNVMMNFLCNALASKRAGRRCEVRLVTQGAVQRRDIDRMIVDLDNPALTTPSRPALDKVIEGVRERYRAAGEPVPTKDDLVALARDILDQVRQAEPVSLRALVAEIERDLYGLYPDPQTMRGIKMTLLGAMFDDAGRGPSEAHPYDRAWVEHLAVPPLFDRGVLDDDAVSACARAVAAVAPRGWDPALCVPRADLRAALNRFVPAPQTVCVVDAATGCGMSWGLFDWAMRGLDGHLRLLVPGDALTTGVRLAGLVGDALQRTTTARWLPPDFLGRMLAAAVDERGPLVVIIQDVPTPSTGTSEQVARALGRLVDECRDVDVKLVLACRTDVWARSALADGIALADLFQPSSQSGQENLLGAGIARDGMPVERPRDDSETAAERRPSVTLDALTPEEMGAIVRLRLGPEVAADVEPQLVDPAYGALRTVFLLDLYLRENYDTLRATRRAPLPAVDRLLDERVDGALGRVARAAGMGVGVNDIRATFDSLVDHLWVARRSALRYADAIRAIEGYLPSLGHDIIAALIREGLLAASGPMALVEPAVAARRFARALRQRVERGEDLRDLDLAPDRDGDVVAALLRDALDPVAEAEHLLASDPRWLVPVADGLAQCPRDDPRIVATLAALSRPQQGRDLAQSAACWALGELASRDDRAYRWVRDMYLGDRDAEQYRGGEALAATFNLAPARVKETMQDLLGRLASDMGPGQETLNEARDRALVRALRPLYGVRHPEAARAARNVLASFQDLLARGDATQWTVDTVRGTLALVLGNGEIDPLLRELRAPDAATRHRAARALRPIAFARPDLVARAFADALGRETEPDVIAALLWAAYRLWPSAADPLLDALALSLATRWSDPASAPTAALTLFLLGKLARTRTARVLGLLPVQLDAYAPEDRAVLAEALAYAWWRCAEHDDGARHQVSALREADLDGVPAAYRVFALRGAVMAHLGAMFPRGGYTDELSDKPTGLGDRRLNAFMVDTDDFAHRHADEVAAHPDAADLEACLLACIQAADRAEARVGFGALHDALFATATSCLEIYTRLLLRWPDPVPPLRALPQEWQALQATRQVLSDGRSDAPVVAYARALCDRFKNGGSAQSAYERRQLVSILDALDGVPADGRDGDSHADIGGHSAGYRFAAAVNARPDEALFLLDGVVCRDDDLPVLFYWVDEARAAPPLIVARLYARMFDERPLDLVEVRDFCLDLRAALPAFRDTPLRRDYEAIYAAILAAIDGRVPAAGQLLHMSSRIGRSHQYAAEALEARCGQGWTADDLADAVVDARGLLESAEFSLSGGSLATHYSRSPIYLYVPLPAARLALTAIAQRRGLPDPMATFMRERREVDALLSDLAWVDHIATTPPADRPPEIRAALESAAARLDSQVGRTPRNERAWHQRGYVALIRGQLDVAEDSLTRCLDLTARPRLLPSAEAIRNSALYNMACVFAQAERPDECRTALEELAGRGQLDCDSARADADLQNVRLSPWFRALCG